MNQNMKQLKIINFAHMMNYSVEQYPKKMYLHAEYLSPEQIKKSEEQTMMQSGELWNLGVILYTLYSGEFPFQGANDEETITSILMLKNQQQWSPKWKDGLHGIARNFISMCLNVDPFLRMDKVPLINDSYILQNHTPLEISSHNKILSSTLAKIYDIYA